MTDNFKQKTESGVLLTDGAMGTYYKELTDDLHSFSEFANISNMDVITRIHREYIRAGAALIRTNTFSANSYSLEIERSELKKIIESGYEAAENAIMLEGVASGVDIGASIGPVRETGEESEFEIIGEYEFIVDTFLEKGADIFVFETFSSTDYLCELAERIKNKNPDSFILTQFAFSSDGFTRDGISVSGILSEIKKCKFIDSYGFNCGAGPSHMLKLFNKAKREVLPKNGIISAIPNAGYPELINDRMVYINNPVYFASIMEEIVNSGAKIVGGCCGTTPKHIEEMSKMLNTGKEGDLSVNIAAGSDTLTKLPLQNNFMGKLKKGEFVVAVELDPPFDTNIEKTIENARSCGKYGIDLVTVADSPRGVARVDSLQTAAKIKRECAVEVMPHLCCRDKNINALRSGLMAAHIEGIRNVLTVTGDPILESDRATTTGVFNLNSYKLMELTNNLNEETFKGDILYYFGALNLNVKNVESQIARMEKKLNIGATAFFTQPIFDFESAAHLMSIKQKYGVKVIAGIMPLVTYKNALFLNNEVPGISVPEKYISRFKPGMSREDAQAAGIEISLEIATSIRQYVDGFYLITPFNRVDIIFKVIDKLKDKSLL